MARTTTHILAIGQKFAVFFLPGKIHTIFLLFHLSSRQFGQIRTSFVLSLLVSFEEEIVVAAAAEHARKSTRVLKKLLDTTTPRGAV